MPFESIVAYFENKKKKLQHSQIKCFRDVKQHINKAFNLNNDYIMQYEDSDGDRLDFQNVYDFEALSDSKNIKFYIIKNQEPLNKITELLKQNQFEVKNINQTIEFPLIDTKKQKTSIPDNQFARISSNSCEECLNFLANGYNIKCIDCEKKTFNQIKSQKMQKKLIMPAFKQQNLIDKVKIYSPISVLVDKQQEKIEILKSQQLAKNSIINISNPTIRVQKGGPKSDVFIQFMKAFTKSNVEIK